MIPTARLKRHFRLICGAPHKSGRDRNQPGHRYPTAVRRHLRPTARRHLNSLVTGSSSPALAIIPPLPMNTAINARKKPGRKMADVWTYFTDVPGVKRGVNIDEFRSNNPNAVRCPFCKQDVSYSGKVDRLQVIRRSLHRGVIHLQSHLNRCKLWVKQ